MFKRLKASALYKTRLRRVIFKVFLVLALGFVGLWAAYILTVNAFLNIGSGPLYSAELAEVRLGSGFTWWPGRVSGHDLQILVHDSKVEMDLRVDHFSVNVSLTSLLKMVFHTTGTEVQGVSLRLRQTRPLAELCQQPPGLPPIPGQADAPGTGTGECLAQAEKATPTGTPALPEEIVHLILEDLNVTDVREVWIEGYRTVGKVSALGRWEFWPTQLISLELQEARVHEASVHQDKARLVQNLDLALAGTLALLRFGHLDAKTFWKAVTVNASTRLEGFELKAIAPFVLPTLDGLSNIQGALHVDAGQVKRLLLDVQASQTSVELPDQRLLSSLRLKLSLDEDLKHPGQLGFSEASLKLDSLQLQEGKKERQEFKDAEITLTVQDSSYLDLNAQKAELDLIAHVSQSKIIIALVPAGLAHFFTNLLVSDNAPAQAKGKLYVTPDQASIQDLQSEADGLHLNGSIIISPKLQGTLTARHLSNSFQIHLGDGDLKIESAPAPKGLGPLGHSLTVGSRR